MQQPTQFEKEVLQALNRIADSLETIISFIPRPVSPRSETAPVSETQSEPRPVILDEGGLTDLSGVQ